MRPTPRPIGLDTPQCMRTGQPSKTLMTFKTNVLLAVCLLGFGTGACGGGSTSPATGGGASGLTAGAPGQGGGGAANAGAGGAALAGAAAMGQAGTGGVVSGAGAGGSIAVLSPMDAVKDMKLGWNLGNTLDSTPGGETAWGNPQTT